MIDKYLYRLIFVEDLEGNDGTVSLKKVFLGKMNGKPVYTTNPGRNVWTSKSSDYFNVFRSGILLPFPIDFQGFSAGNGYFSLSFGPVPAVPGDQNHQPGNRYRNDFSLF